MIFLEILLAILIGILFGIFTGLVPGIHINLVSVLLVSVSSYLLGFTSPVVLGAFIVSMSVTHTFLDTIPSIFLGAPSEDTALSVLPGHRLLLKGMGYEAVKLTVIGSLLCLILTLIMIPFVISYLPKVYTFMSPYIGWILLGVSIFMILKENGLDKRFWGFYVFMISGIFGLIVLNIPNLKQPLLPMLSGLFGISTLLVSLFQEVEIPKQRITEMVKVPKLKGLKAILGATISGSLIGIFPGLGSAQAAIISMQFVGELGVYAFLVLIGGINTVNFVFSLVTLYTIQKARNGTVVAIFEILKSISLNDLLIFMGAALLAGGIATFLTLKIAKLFSGLITKISYPKLVLGVTLFIVALVFYFSSWLGLLILIVSTAIGIVPALIGVKRSLAMGCLMLPVILFFLV